MQYVTHMKQQGVLMEWNGSFMLQQYRMKRKWTSDFHLLLYRYMPTPKDAERYQSFKGSSSELHVVDQFMLEVRRCAIYRTLS